jgi:hypothetical protein
MPVPAIEADGHVDAVLGPEPNTTLAAQAPLRCAAPWFC